MKQIRKTITKAEIAAMPKVLFPGRIFVIYTESEAEKAVAYLKDQRIVGVDTETRPSFKRGTTHKVALLQISTQDTCFLFRLNRIGMPDSLQEFLMSDTLKIGLSLKDDFNSLRKRENVHHTDECQHHHESPRHRTPDAIRRIGLVARDAQDAHLCIPLLSARNSHQHFVRTVEPHALFPYGNCCDYSASALVEDHSGTLSAATPADR